MFSMQSELAESIQRETEGFDSVVGKNHARLKKLKD